MDVSELADKDGVLRVRVQPGPSMRWFAQGFFMGLGFIVATGMLWLLGAVIIAALVSGSSGR